MTPAKDARSWLQKASTLGRLLENLLLSVLLLGMIGLASTQILLRWSGSGSLAWGDEAVRLMVLWIAMIAGIASAREDRHISIEVLPRFLSAKGRAIAAVVVDLFTVAVCLALAWYGYEMVALAFEFDDVLLDRLPAWPFQAVIPVAFLLIAYRYVIWTMRRLRVLVQGEDS
ncbi:MAG: TRAP transporter small permease [Gammaproteobacteria bacterium]|nr:TRAP transporter small permease [Gammaproteobacteria bacterium]